MAVIDYEFFMKLMQECVQDVELAQAAQKPKACNPALNPARTFFSQCSKLNFEWIFVSFVFEIVSVSSRTNRNRYRRCHRPKHQTRAFRRYPWLGREIFAARWWQLSTTRWWTLSTAAERRSWKFWSEPEPQQLRSAERPVPTKRTILIYQLE